MLELYIGGYGLVHPAAELDASEHFSMAFTKLCTLGPALCHWLLTRNVPSACIASSYSHSRYCRIPAGATVYS